MTTQVNLTAAINANLLSLQQTQTLLNQTQLSLSTGKKVNSALDNPEAFFAAQALTNRSGDLSNVLDGISQGVQTIQTANDGITAITSLLQQAQSVAQQALSESNANAGGTPTDATSLAASFNQILAQITNLANDATYQGTNLLNSTTNSLTITYDETGHSTQSIQGVNFTAGSTGLQNAGILPPIIGSVSLPGAGNVAELATVPPQTGGVGIGPDLGSYIQTGSVNDTGQTFAGTSQIVVNGTTIQVGGQTLAQVASDINAASGNTGVNAAESAGNPLVLTASSTFPLNITDGTGLNSGGLAALGLVATPQNGTGGGAFDTVVINGQSVNVGQYRQSDLLSNLNSAGVTGGFTASIGAGNHLVITSTTAGQPLTIANGSGSGLADIGFAATNIPAPNDSFSIQVGAGPVTTIVTGGQTTSQVLAALNAVSGITATQNGAGQLVISSTQVNTPITLADVVTDPNASTDGLGSVGLPAGTISNDGGGLGISDANNGVSGTALDWAGASASADIKISLAQVAAALTTVRAQASTLGQNLGTVQTYQSFNKNLINDLNAGANDLTAADTNQESAALLTLQTQQQLGISALSLASQAQQAVLKLFP
jgi:flagellin-like hook-associated protein FlgL